MKILSLKLALLSVVFGVFGVVGLSEAKTIRVNSYTRKSTGTYVAPYYRTTPNYTKFDNYSTKGNYNPYNGKSGYASPFKSYKF